MTDRCIGCGSAIEPSPYRSVCSEACLVIAVGDETLGPLPFYEGLPVIDAVLQDANAQAEA